MDYRLPGTAQNSQPERRSSSSVMLFGYYWGYYWGIVEKLSFISKTKVSIAGVLLLSSLFITPVP
ncbi:MAG: hypothetical protein K2Z81_14810, partial [Cyanobacteria bacterium]|nr:hypothetical protein [Cyanobacteriota bacterium]